MGANHTSLHANPACIFLTSHSRKFEVHMKTVRISSKAKKLNIMYALLIVKVYCILLKLFESNSSPIPAVIFRVSSCLLPNLNMASSYKGSSHIRERSYPHLV